MPRQEIAAMARKENRKSEERAEKKDRWKFKSDSRNHDSRTFSRTRLTITASCLATSKAQKKKERTLSWLSVSFLLEIPSPCRSETPSRERTNHRSVLVPTTTKLRLVREPLVSMSHRLSTCMNSTVDRLVPRWRCPRPPRRRRILAATNSHSRLLAQRGPARHHTPPSIETYDRMIKPSAKWTLKSLWSDPRKPIREATIPPTRSTTRRRGSCRFRSGFRDFDSLLRVVVVESWM
jgi:hypothetical protein